MALEPEARAALGLFLSFQYPVEIPGVPILTFLRTALNAQRKARGEAEMSSPDFLRFARAKAAALKIEPEKSQVVLRKPLTNFWKKSLFLLPTEFNRLCFPKCLKRPSTVGRYW